ncbi:histidine phosphatase family protein [Mesorhizobium amorphae]
MTAAGRRGSFPADDPIEDRTRAAISALESLHAATRVWTSPALRARQTAEALGLQATDMPALQDQDFGAWAGRAFEDVQRDQPDAVGAWLIDPDATPPDGENFKRIATRTASLLDEQVAEPGHTIAVTHPAVVRAAILHVLKAPLTSFRFIDVEPLSFADFRSDGTRWQLRASGVKELEALHR